MFRFVACIEFHPYCNHRLLQGKAPSGVFCDRHIGVLAIMPFGGCQNRPGGV